MISFSRSHISSSSCSPGQSSILWVASSTWRSRLSRLRESESQAMLRLKQEQLEILEKIKAANQGGAANAEQLPFSLQQPGHLGNIAHNGSFPAAFSKIP